tara:strand:+ start:371 stop:1258 length:888 start_codon:yes stop_codon:yes gene_type:complete
MKFLIAEDTFEVLEYIRKYLIESGHFVFCANDGEEALKIFQKEEIDGIFCVLTLPKLGGLELLNEVKSSSKTCPFVMICPHEDSENALDALQLGACDFLIKTIKNHDLQRTLDRVTNLTDGFNSGEYAKSYLLQETRTLEIGNDFEVINSIVAFISQDLTNYGILDKTQLFRMNVLLKEAIENAIFHGNLGMDSNIRRENSKLFYKTALQKRDLEPYKDRKVMINFEINTNSAKYVVRDEGKGFAHAELLDQLDPDNLLQIEGRGLVMIKNFMDEVFWNERGNEITMVRYRKRKN